MNLPKLRWGPARLAVVTASALALMTAAACSSSNKTGTASTPTNSETTSATSSASAPAAGSSSAAAATPVDTAKTVFVFNSTPQEQDLPELMAIDAMKSQGYDISIKQLDGSVLPFQAL
ncbi:MAG TPA: hypothetical protein VN738_03080, partial [Acidothermaceae bacterium]|nr:hypothetical protein [Acidothermaceae bacterium]